MRLSGSITALATPFAASGAIDSAAWSAMIEHQLHAGTQALVVAGSTGEAAMLADRELEQLIRLAVAQVGGRVPVLAGAGASGTARTMEQCGRASDAGVDAVLVVTPPYVRPTQEGLRRHYEAVASTARVPVVLYNVPGRTGVDLLPETVAELAAHPNIIGIKEAVPDAARMHALLALRSSDFVVLSGDDASACQAQLAGADGVVSVVSNVAPAAFARLSALARSGRADDARALDDEMAFLFAAMGVEPNPIPVKAVLAELGLCEDVLRLPLLPLSSHHRGLVNEVADRIRRLETGVFPPLAV